MLLSTRNAVSLNCAIGDRDIGSTNLVDRLLTTATSKGNLLLENSAFLWQSQKLRSRQPK
jgi:hypothetical protein